MKRLYFKLAALLLSLLMICGVLAACADTHPLVQIFVD